MMESEPWERFWVSGKIEDYLLYAGMAEKPETSAVNRVAGSDAVISGKTDREILGRSNVSTVAKQESEYS